MAETLIRKARNEDLSVILKIYNHSILHTTSVYSDDPHDLSWIKNWYAQKQNLELPVLVYEIEGGICGFASYGQFRTWPGYKYTVEHSVHVHPNHRRKGIASSLLKALLDEARNQGLHAMIGGVDAANESSIELHEKLGFRKVGLLPEVGTKFGRWLDLQFMQIIL